MGAQETPIRKTYEIKTGSDSLNVEFLGANRQFDWIEISIVNDKSDKHTTIYDSYNRTTCSNNKKYPIKQFYRNIQPNQRKKIQPRQLNPKTFTL